MTKSEGRNEEGQLFERRRRSSDSQWHLSKSVPIALIAAIAMQSGLAVWWASDVDTRLGSVENTVSDYNNTKTDVATLMALQKSILFEIREMRSDVKELRNAQINRHETRPLPSLPNRIQENQDEIDGIYNRD